MRTISKHAATAAAFAGLTALIAPVVMAADASGQDTGTLSEIIVTAERRAESIQSVPLSVTAITADTMAKFDIVSFDDYAHLVPNLSFGTGNTFGITNGREITIRGVAGTNTTSYYINDTPLPISIDPRAVDLQRIEVLRGPQGTLFGASAMGGTVRLITRQPDLAKSFGSADVQTYVIHEGGLGYMVSANYNLSLVDNQMAVLLSGYSTYNPGVFTGQYGIPTMAMGPGGPWPNPTVPASQPRQTVDHLGNDVEAGATLSLTYRPAALDALTITPLIMYQDQSNNGFPLADYYTQNLTQVRPLNIRESDTDIWQFANLTIKYAAPFGSFINSSTYFHRYSRDTEDGSELISIGGYGGPPVPTCVAGVYCASPSPNWVKSNQFTEELRFESSFPGPFQLVAGAYYNKLRQFIVSAQVLPYDGFGNPAFTENIPRVNEESAGFLSGTYNIFDKVEISAGVRQSHLEFSNAYIANGWINGGPSDSPVSSNQRATTPRFTAKYKFDASNMIYANAAKGYRIGGANSQLPNIPSNPCPPQYTSGTTPFGSDSLWSYEIGSKNTWLDGRVNSRLAAYRINWNQIQQVILLACSFHVTENVGSAVSKGGELEIDGAPIEGLYVNLGLGYEDAAFTESPPGSPLPAGSPLNGVPRWTGSLLGDYSFPMSFGKGFVRAQYSYTGASVSDNNPLAVNISTLAQRQRGGYSLTSLFVGGKQESWEASLFVKNLFDVRGNLGDEQSEISELPGRPRWMITTPRTVGIDVKKQF
jgi:outer membrane receptor protein involved in Fe transport